MQSKKLNRRSFVKRAVTAAVAAGLAPSQITRLGRAAEEPSQGRFVRLGGPAFQRADDPEALARAHRKLGYTAAYCPNIPLKDTDRIQAARKAFAKHGVVIAEVGRWVNLLDSDPEKRKANLQRVTDGLVLAEAIDAKCCVDIAGSYNPKIWYGPHPDNLSQQFFDAAVENARKIIDAVKPKRAKFCYEMMGWALPDSPESCLDLLKAVDREAFAVHLDPCNLINSPSRYYKNTALLNECFDKLGRWIVSCHAKDLTWDVEMSVHFREVRPGTGVLDYRTYLERLTRLPHRPPLMLEHLPTAQEYDKARLHIQEFGKQAGIRFG